MIKKVKHINLSSDKEWFIIEYTSSFGASHSIIEDVIPLSHIESDVYDLSDTRIGDDALDVLVNMDSLHLR